MDESPSPNLPPSEEPTTQNDSPALSQISRAFIPQLLPRRIVLLFASSFAAFSLTTWFLARMNNGTDEPQDAGTAEGVVREQLDALARGETRVAYALFSPRYRNEISFEAFDTMVREHGAMFHANSIRKESESGSVERAEITMRLDVASGDRFIARYALVAIEGRWWIDEMHWHLDAPPADRVVTRNLGGESRRNFAAADESCRACG
jgi:Domain of unknown function (DUF4864)